jgi:hypothetical protein
MYKIASASLAGNAFNTLQTMTWSAGFERLMTGNSAQHQAEFVALMRQMSTANIATRKISAVESFAFGSSSLFYRALTQGGVHADSWKSITGENSLVIPRTVTWSAGAAAVLAVDVMWYSTNGITAPLTVGGTTGLTSVEADVWVGAGTGVSSITVDFGFQAVTPPDGHLYPIDCYISAQRPRIRIITNDFTSLTTAAANPGSISSLTATFSKLTDGGVRGASKTYTLTGHVAVEEVADGEPGTVAVTCEGKGGLTIS